MNQAQHDAKRATAPTGLARCHQKRVAVAIDHPKRRQVVVRGVAYYTLDTTLGRVLRIDLEPNDPESSAAPGSSSLLICERQWRGKLYSGKRFECDYLLDLRTSAVPSSGDTR